MTVLTSSALASSQGKEMAAKKGNPQRSASRTAEKRKPHLVRLGGRLTRRPALLFVLFRITAAVHNVAVSSLQRKCQEGSIRRLEERKAYLAVRSARRLFFCGSSCVFSYSCSSSLLISFWSTDAFTRSFRLRATFAGAGAIFSCNTCTSFPMPPESTSMCIAVLVRLVFGATLWRRVEASGTVSGSTSPSSGTPCLGSVLTLDLPRFFVGGGDPTFLLVLGFRRVPANKRARFDFAAACFFARGSSESELLPL